MVLKKPLLPHPFSRSKCRKYCQLHICFFSCMEFGKALVAQNLERNAQIVLALLMDCLLMLLFRF
uniref:Uncharacterized protein n=1 Tax=Rhizophora mucronata TaxID=61149 RepID=A0A2P2PME0_RHIMU